MKGCALGLVGLIDIHASLHQETGQVRITANTDKEWEEEEGDTSLNGLTL